MPSTPAVPIRILLPRLLLALIFMARAECATATIDVWVDPGHGNQDIGTPGIDGPAHPNEADLTMPTASSLYDWLITFGYDVHLTRNSEANNPAILLKPRARTRILNGLDPNDETHHSRTVRGLSSASIWMLPATRKTSAIARSTRRRSIGTRSPDPALPTTSPKASGLRPRSIQTSRAKRTWRSCPVVGTAGSSLETSS